MTVTKKTFNLNKKTSLLKEPCILVNVLCKFKVENSLFIYSNKHE